MDIFNSPVRQPLALLAITNVEDSNGNFVSNGGTTSDTALTLSGGGTANAVVWIVDNGARFATASVTTNGTWEKSFIAAFGQHEFSLQEGASEWKSWGVTVETAAVKPVITRIEDSQGVLIPDGRETSDTRVTVFGTAQRGSYVSIDDDSESWGAAPAADGTWTKTLNGLMVKEYSITAKGLYDNEPVSDAWRFRVDVSQPDIVYENFNFEPDRMFYGPGSTIEVPTMKFTMSAGERTAALGIAPVQEGVPLMDGQFVTMGYSVQGDHLPTTVIIDFNGGYSKVRLALLVFGQTVTCTCYDAFDITLAVKDFLPGSQWAELSAPDGRAIYKIKMYMRGLCWLDNFTMWI